MCLICRYQQQRRRRDGTEDAGLVCHIRLKEVINFFNTCLGFDAGMFLYHAASTILKFYNPSL